MARPSIEHLCIDLSDAGRKRELLASVGCLSGLYRVKVEPTRKTRSLQANSFYWSVVVKAFSEFLRGQDYEDNDSEFCHSCFKSKFLAKEFCDPATGEVLTTAQRTTTKLNTLEFYEYVEKCRTWLNFQFGIITPDPEPSYWRQTLPEEVEA